jgi:O-antigen/teichoic acid export membrane protein
MPSIAKNSLARFSADAAGLVLGGATSIMTARWLGPAGKGELAALVFLVSLIAQIFLCGIGDSLIVRVCQGKTTLQAATATAILVAVIAGIAGAGFYWAAAAIQFRQDFAQLQTGIALASAVVPLMVLYQLAISILNSQERIASSSGVMVLNSFSTAALTWLAVVWFGGGVRGAVLAMLAAAGLACVWAYLRVGSVGVKPIGKPDRQFLRFAASYGPKVQFSALLAAVAARFDLLLVYSLAGQAAAGLYSVALTAGVLNGMVSLALVVASFPRLAALGERAALELALRLNRTLVACSVGTGVLLAAVMPFALPLAFGRAYEAAIWPTMVLLAGSVFGGSQYVLARAMAARGSPRLLVESFAISAGVMIALDFLLIPRFGIVGAAAASSLSFVAGYGRCVVEFRRITRAQHVRLILLPTIHDLAVARESLTFLLQSLMPARAKAEVAR